MRSGSQMAARVAGWLPGGEWLLERAAGTHDPRLAPIFMLHRVLPDPSQCYQSEMAVSVATLERFLDWLVKVYDVMHLEDLDAHMRARRIRRPACALTFDDGWRDTFTYAFPLLQRRGLRATVFLPLRFIGSGRHFWQEKLYFHLQKFRGRENGGAALRRVGEDFAWCPGLGAGDLSYCRLSALLLRRSSAEAEAFVERLGEAAGPSLELAGPAFMNWDDVRTMQAAGIVFGSHTLEHTLLRNADPATSELELRQSRQALSDILGHEVTTLSYPWGGVGPFGRELAAAAGYRLAVTVEGRLARTGDDPLMMPRIALSEAQLGGNGGANGAAHRWRPGTIAVHLMRARAPRRAPKPRLGNDGRLRMGFVVDNPQAWARQPDSHRGGSELQLRRILEALDPSRFEVELYFLRNPSPGLDPALAWPCFAAAPAEAGPLTTIPSIWRLLRQRQPALVQAMFQDGLFQGIPGAWLARVPARLCARRNAGHWKQWHHRWGLGVINRMATAWQTNSTSVGAMLIAEEGVQPEAIEILPNWLDLERFQPATEERRQAARERLGMPADAFVVAAVANYTPVKNHAVLVEAAARVCAELPPALFVFVGEGPEEAGLNSRISALGLEGRVGLVGAVDDVETYLAAADVGVLSSRSEGCSNAVLEYMAAGLPVVLSDIPANRALTRGSLIHPDDAALWAAALLALAADPEMRRRQGQANRQRVQSYGGAGYAEMVQAHYVRAAGNRQI